MMAEWSASSVQLCCFNADGIVDYERWAALPDGKHIVVLLKETNALSGSLVDFLSHGGSKTYYRTWNMDRHRYGIIRAVQSVRKKKRSL